MLRIVILRKSMLFWISGDKKRQQCFLNNFTVQVCIHGSIKCTDLCGSFKTDACPDVHLHGMFGPNERKTSFMLNHALIRVPLLEHAHYFGTCSATHTCSLDNQMHKHCACKNILYVLLAYLGLCLSGSPRFLQQKRLCVSS